MNALAQLVEFENAVQVLPFGHTRPSISIIGLGYVGAVSTACLAGLGHHVIGCDLDVTKTTQIAAGRSPIHEEGLEYLLRKGVARNLISTTTNVADAVANTDVTFVSVGTPTSEDGGCDCRSIVSAASAIGEGLRRKDSYHLVVMRCSVPPATTLNVMVPEIEAVSGLTMGEDFGICFNPEFLREGTAIADFDAPPKTVIGANDMRAAETLKEVYAPVDPDPLITSIEVAETVKYVDNVWHATKVCFANEIGRICKPLSIDSHAVMDIFVKDTKLNLSPYYLKPGFAYGGSCLPKEVRAVDHLASSLGVETPLISSLSKTNRIQIDEATKLIRDTGARKIGFLGLAFKAGTDDLRESPILEVMNTLIEEGFDIAAYDPAIQADTRVTEQFNYVRHVCPHLEPTVCALPELLRENLHQVFDECEVVVTTQRTREIQTLVASQLGRTQVVDLVHLFSEKPQFEGYQGIGW